MEKVFIEIGKVAIEIIIVLFMLWTFLYLPQLKEMKRSVKNLFDMLFFIVLLGGIYRIIFVGIGKNIVKAIVHQGGSQTMALIVVGIVVGVVFGAFFAFTKQKQQTLAFTVFFAIFLGVIIALIFHSITAMAAIAVIIPIDFFSKPKSPLEKALKRYEKISAYGKPVKILNCLQIIAQLYEQKEEPEKALEYLHKAKALESPDITLYVKACILTNIGRVYHQQKKYEQALEVYQKIPQAEDSISMCVLLNTASIFFDQGKSEKTLEYLKQVQDLYEKKSKGINNNMEKYRIATMAWEKMAEVYFYLGETDKALKFYHKFFTYGYYPATANSLFQFAKLHYNDGKYNIAFNNFQEALKISQQYNDSFSYTKSLACIGKIYIIWNQLDKAMESAQLALEASKETNDTNVLVETLECLALLHSTKKEFEQALNYTQKLLDIDPDNYSHYYHKACIHSLKEEKENTFKYLKLSLEKGLKNVDWLQEDETLEFVRQEPEFKELCKQVEVSEVKSKHGRKEFRNLG